MIVIETYKGKSITEHRVEIVERKGTGHPDYMCDSMMDAISVALSKEYIKQFGTILHHNIEKGLLAAGRVKKNFGGGKVLKPMELTIGDRATFRAGNKEMPVADIAKEIYEKVEGIKEVHVLLLSRIGTPIDEPQVATAQVLLERGRRIGEVAKTAEEIFEREFSGINKFCMDLSRGKYPVC